LFPFPESELRCCLEVEGPTRALNAEEVERRLVGDVLDLGGERERHRVAAHEVRERERVQELRGHDLLELAQAHALPAAEELVHVAGVPGERDLVVGGGDLTQLKARRAVCEEVGPVRDAVALEVAEGALARPDTGEPFATVLTNTGIASATPFFEDFPGVDVRFTEAGNEIIGSYTEANIGEPLVREGLATYGRAVDNAAFGRWSAAYLRRMRARQAA